jgi:hypothetical protein
MPVPNENPGKPLEETDILVQTPMRRTKNLLLPSKPSIRYQASQR